MKAVKITSVITLTACMFVAAAAVGQTERLAAEGKFHGGSPADHQLWMAAYDGQFDQVKQAVDQGANVNIRGKGGFAPIVIAARNGHLQIVQYLMQHGASIDQRDNNRKKSALLAAAFEGQYDTAAYLVDHGAQINVQAINGWTPLHDAAYIGDSRIVKLLVDHGARLDLKNGRDETPLQTAERGQFDAVRRGNSHASPEEYRETIDYMKSRLH